MEFERFEKIKTLKDKGWHQDDECQTLQHQDTTFGGGTYMKSPEGDIYKVTSTSEVPFKRN
jgi:hypothetical protein